jgi:protein-tyrosine phosphatase
MIKVLFVCTGNICRSPTAAGVMRQLVRAAGLEHALQVDSAGTHGYHVGDCPDLRSQAAARARSYDLSRLRARQIDVRDFAEFDHVLAMDREHLEVLRRASPAEHRHKVRLFLEFAPGLSRDEVPDPYYGDNAAFELVLDLVEAGCRELLAQLRRQLARQ